jgi:hypothetical protein
MAITGAGNSSSSRLSLESTSTSKCIGLFPRCRCGCVCSLLLSLEKLRVCVQLRYRIVACTSGEAKCTLIFDVSQPVLPWVYR